MATNIVRPSALFALAFSGLFWFLIAVATDTAFYIGPEATTSFRALFDHICTTPVITPINNIIYNTQASNLAQHGLHPWYQHILINLPQLLGPALICLLNYPPTFNNTANMRAALQNPQLTSALTGILILSIIPHQEARFLQPVIPLLLTCIRLPQSNAWRKRFWASWFVFNISMATLMGVFHQGGIIPAQLEMPNLITQSLNTTHSSASNIEVFWWKTYPPPTFLLGAGHVNPSTNATLKITTTPLLGLKQPNLPTRLLETLNAAAENASLLEQLSNAILPTPLQTPGTTPEIFLAAPLSAWRFDSTHPPSLSNFSFSLPLAHQSTSSAEEGESHVRFTHLYTYRKHINLDDMDFGDDGVWPTLQRVVGRRGVGVWRVDVVEVR